MAFVENKTAPTKAMIKPIIVKGYFVFSIRLRTNARCGFKGRVFRRLSYREERICEHVARVLHKTSKINIKENTVISWIFAATFLSWLWKTVLFLLLCFGSLLWALSIIAVLWGVYDGLLPAIKNKMYKKAFVIFIILSLTVTVIVLSVNKRGIYLIGFILPILLLNLYIKKFIRIPYLQKRKFYNN
jgi:hypothetical protein